MEGEGRGRGPAVVSVGTSVGVGVGAGACASADGANGADVALSVAQSSFVAAAVVSSAGSPGPPTKSARLHSPNSLPMHRLKASQGEQLPSSSSLKLTLELTLVLELVLVLVLVLVPRYETTMERGGG